MSTNSQCGFHGQLASKCTSSIPKPRSSQEDEVKWQEAVNEFIDHDRDVISGWQSALDVLMLFATLFAAILSAFLIESSKDLKADATVDLLAQIAMLLANGTSGGVDSQVGIARGRFRPTSTTITVNRLWYISLALTLGSAVVLMLAKQWLEEYKTPEMSSKSLDQDLLKEIKYQAALVAYQHQGLEEWTVPHILGILPIVLHTALVLFAGGLIVRLWKLRSSPVAHTKLLSPISLRTLEVRSTSSLIPAFPKSEENP